MSFLRPHLKFRDAELLSMPATYTDWYSRLVKHNETGRILVKVYLFITLVLRPVKHEDKETFLVFSYRNL